MGLLAEVPAWYWQVLGAICGLALGLYLGGGRKRKAGKGSRAAQQSSGRASRLAVPADLRMAPDSRFSEPRRAEPRMAEPKPVEPKPVEVRVPPPRPAEPPADANHQRAFELLRDNNLDLSAKLRAATDLHARELLERSQQQQLDQQRYERQLEELRQNHATELSQLMTAMVDQVDAMQRDHAQQIQGMEQEMERLRRASQAAADGPDALTRPVNITVGGDMRPPADAAASRMRKP